MPLINRIALREKANFFFADFRKVPVTKPELCELFAAAVRGHRGASVFESWHGTYAYALMMAEMMPRWSQEGVTRLYTEIVPFGKQDLLDRWQDDGDDRGITDYFDSRFTGYSKKMWQHYWLLLQAARKSGIRVVGIDKPEIQTGYGAVFTAPFKNMYWESVIEKDQSATKQEDKFIVHGGVDHGTDFGGVLKGIHQRLQIPRIIMNEGAYAVARHPFDKIPSFAVQIPLLPTQDPREKINTVRNIPVKWPV